jgi:hypothetical protein
MAADESDARLGSVVSVPLLEKIEMLRLAIPAASWFRPDSVEVPSTAEREPYSKSDMTPRSSNDLRML